MDDLSRLEAWLSSDQLTLPCSVGQHEQCAGSYRRAQGRMVRACDCPCHRLPFEPGER